MFKLFAKPMVVPVKEPVGAIQTIPQGYAALALRAGVANYSKAVDDVEFPRFLAENGIAVFNTRKVQDYLERMCPRGKRVQWVSTKRSATIRNTDIGGDHYVWERNAPEAYSKPIPEPVLMTMVKIREKYDLAEFFISDFTETPAGDPFLAVVFNDKEYIIERWDEPGFRM